MRLVKEILEQINKSKFTEDINDAEKLIEKSWDKNYKSTNDLFWRYHHNNRLKELYNSATWKENPCIPRKFLPNYKSKETPEEK